MKVVAYKDKHGNIHAIKKDQVHADLRINLDNIMNDLPISNGEYYGNSDLDDFDNWFDKLKPLDKRIFCEYVNSKI